MPDAPLRLAITTPRAAGAVAIIDIVGNESDLSDCLAKLTRQPADRNTADARARLRNIAGIDDGLVIRISPTHAQLSLHGGVGITDNIVGKLMQLGAHTSPPLSPTEQYPEADSPIQADALATIATAASPAAIDVLAHQPNIWRAWHATQDRAIPTTPQPLDHLLTPPTIVFIGKPNVGKSTLLNALSQRTAAITSPIAGTTRDHVAAQTKLPLPTSSDARSNTPQHLVVRLLDTPGIRSTDDAIEAQAIDKARQLIANADCLIAIRDPDHDWPSTQELAREPDLLAFNKADLIPALSTDLPHGTIILSATQGQGLTELTAAIIAHLKLPLLDQPADLAPWPFCSSLIDAIGDPAFDWTSYLRQTTPTYPLAT